MIRIFSYSIYHSSNAYLGHFLAERALGELPVEVVRSGPTAEIKQTIFATRHAPPGSFGFNRTTWWTFGAESFAATDEPFVWTL